ncbi:anaerobic ribonucleoside-triphosphate reductase activating protein [Slackia faecicanis]|uniref:Anaerobic ribonucleoside-triphosphate reductase-activating protein n=1 Tax=Slackia faecicanis TaxID=255723 RepID=A0A3N0AHD9_9ACTN|nr:anaerobic ribonucleoside-triphosphate reductase activating protein [Slackia faecicanis]
MHRGLLQNHLPERGCKVNYSTIKYCDIANGEGVRTTLFVSGCRRRCPFCFNEEAWSFAAGRLFDDETQNAILASLEPAYIDGLSVLGGEPMEPENQRGLVSFLETVKARYPEKSIWCYTGDTYEELVSGPKRTEDTERLLASIDVLVDGPFIQELKDITLRFRGSSNQRIIDMAATRAAGKVVLWADDPVFATHTMD